MLNRKVEFLKNKLANDLKQAIENQKSNIKFFGEIITLLQKEDERFTNFSFMACAIVVYRFDREKNYLEKSILSFEQVERAFEDEQPIKKLIELFEEEILNVE